MDTVYPEPTSLLYRRPVRKKLRGNAARHRTQPVTFAEIQEVDEENLEDIPEGTKVNSCRNKSDADLNRKFDEFRQLRDKKFSKSAEGECPSDETSPILDPIPSGGHPLDAVSSSTRNKCLNAPPKQIQRPSI